MKLETCGRASCMQIQAATQVAFDNQLALLKSLLNRTVAERDHLRNSLHTCGPTCSKAGCVNARLSAEIVALRLDAERYQWLRDNSCSVGYPSSEGSENEDAYLVITGYDERYQLTTPQRDEAVDNEIAKQGTKK